MITISDHTELGEDPNASLEQILVDSCRALFEAYGIDISTGRGPESPEPLLGRIHFVGRDMSGNLTIGLDRAQLMKSLPFETENQADLEDWVGELANQLMGLVKTRLQASGVDVMLSLPLAVKPSSPPDGPRWPSHISQFSVSCSFAQALTSLDGVLTAEVKLNAPGVTLG